MKVQLVYFEGCPNLEPTRRALHEALRAERLDVPIDEIDLAAPDAPAWARGWGSPTILIDGVDLTGARRASGTSCRLYAGGAPSVDEIRARLVAARDAEPSTSRPAALPMVGAIMAAHAASACCVVPAVLGVVGLTGAGFGAALAPYRTYFLIASGVALGLGFWLVYRRTVDACGCAVPRARRSARVALWVTAALVVAVAAYPALGGGSAHAGSEDAPAAATTRLEVSGMDCPACTEMIANRIKRVPGVVSASVDFDTGIAVVRHDGRTGLEAAAIAAVVDAGFTAKVVP